MLRVAVAGALGRMGRLSRDAIRSAPDMRFAGGYARTAVPAEQIDDDLERLIAAQRPDVLVDFTTRPATQRVARTAVEHGIRVAIGSSEWDEEERSELRALCERHHAGALLVPNFALGAVLMMSFARQAARFFPTAEIVELHRLEKRDKPSGTAGATAQCIREHGGPAAVPIHSVRLEGLLAHHEVLFGNTGELLTIRHDSFSRESFVAGILLAIRNAGSVQGLVVGLDSLLFAASANLQ